MHSLPLFHRIAGSRVGVVGDGEIAAAKRRLIERAGGICSLRQARLLGIVHNQGISAAVLARGRADAVRLTLEEIRHPCAGLTLVVRKTPSP